MKLSLCTVCMNRIDHIKQTLPKNLENCLTSKDQVEYLLLDYNSSDGLATWIRQNLQRYIDMEILTYYRFEDREFFDRSHSRNLAFKLAKGNLVCNVDADNFIGAGFPEYLLQIFSSQRKIFASPANIRDVLGRFCISKQQFLDYDGYDESMSGYGFEDLDIYKRLLISEFNKVTITDKRFLQFIPHNNSYRFENEYHGQNIAEIFLRYIEPWKTEIIFFYKNHDVHLVTLLNLEIVNAQKNIEYAYENPNEKSSNELITYSEDDNLWIKGKFQRDDAKYVLLLENLPNMILLPIGKDILQDDHSRNEFYKVTEPNFLNGLKLMRSELDNRNTMDKRSVGTLPKVNPNGFGKGTVRKNFSDDNVIIL